MLIMKEEIKFSHYQEKFYMTFIIYGRIINEPGIQVKSLEQI